MTQEARTFVLSEPKPQKTMPRIQDIQEMSKFLDTYGMNSPEAKKKIITTAQIIMDNINRHLRDLKVSPYNPDHKGTGDLKRTIHWKVFNAASGNEVLMKFYVQNISSFVELATQRRAHATLIAPVSGKRYEGVQRDDDYGHAMRRKAKPFISNEIRLHARILHRLLVNDFAYLGHAYMIVGLNATNMHYMNEGEKRSLLGARWEIDEVSRFGYKLMGESK